MRFLHSLFLVSVLGICYLLFFRSQAPADATGREEAKAAQAAPAVKSETPFPAPAPHSQYKRDIDQAHAVANQMKASHKEADSF